MKRVIKSASKNSNNGKINASTKIMEILKDPNAKAGYDEALKFYSKNKPWMERMKNL